MAIGYYGDVIFQVSTDKILTFKDFKENSSAKIEKHERIGQKPLSEFCGPELDTSSMTIVLKANNGINPIKEYKKLKTYNQNGEAHELVIGGEIIGQDKYVIIDMSASYNIIYRNGFVFSMQVDLNLEEYIENTKNIDNPKTPDKNKEPVYKEEEIRDTTADSQEESVMSVLLSELSQGIL